MENHNLLPPSGISMNIVPCSCDAQEALHIHGRKTKDQLLYFGPAKAKLQPNEGQAEIISLLSLS